MDQPKRLFNLSKNAQRAIFLVLAVLCLIVLYVFRGSLFYKPHGSLF